MQLSGDYLMSSNGLELLNKIFLSAGEGIIIVNESGKIVLANRRSTNMFGYQKDELLSQTIEAIIPKEYRHEHVAHRTGYVKDPTARRMGEGRDLIGLKKDGSTFPLEVSLSFITHEDHRLIVAFVTDISTRKRQEQALHDSRKKLQDHARELESKVRERTQELEHLNMGLKSQIRERKLAESALKKSLEDIQKAESDILKSLEKEKELNELKSRFISMASHEFRTPLTTILSSANLIGKYPESGQQTKRKKHVDRIRGSVQNLTSILNDFLSLEKLESGAINLKPNEFDLCELVGEVKEDFELSVKNGQFIEVKGESRLKVTTDIQIVKNIILNLVSNAIKYSDEGTKITLTIENLDEDVLVKVKDEGIGIPEAEQKNLFRRFYRAENATNIQGTGLGLNIVKRYTELINGNVTFVSKQGEGSEFSITFQKELSTPKK